MPVSRLGLRMGLQKEAQGLFWGFGRSASSNETSSFRVFFSFQDGKTREEGCAGAVGAGLRLQVRHLGSEGPIFSVSPGGRDPGSGSKDPWDVQDVRFILFGFIVLCFALFFVGCVLSQHHIGFISTFLTFKNLPTLTDFRLEAVSERAFCVIKGVVAHDVASQHDPRCPPKLL